MFVSSGVELEDGFYRGEIWRTDVYKHDQSSSLVFTLFISNLAGICPHVYPRNPHILPETVITFSGQRPYGQTQDAS